jgi:hypothetical protein
MEERPFRNEEAGCQTRRHVLECESDVHDSERAVLEEKGRSGKQMTLSESERAIMDQRGHLANKTGDERLSEAVFHEERARRCSRARSRFASGKQETKR